MTDDIRTWKTSEILTTMFSTEAQQQQWKKMLDAGASLEEISKAFYETFAECAAEIDRRIPGTMTLVFGPID